MVVSSLKRMRFAVPVESAHAAVVRQMVRQRLERSGFSSDLVEDVVLALGEAFANAVAHGGGTRCERVHLRVWASIHFVRVESAGGAAGPRGCRVVIELRYPGEPFDARPPAEPSLDDFTGRGRFLMAVLMDAVTYRFPPGETIVRLEKKIRAARS